MAQLAIRNVEKVFPGGTRAVDAASIDIADGEFIVLVGPSGCGKSTILRMIAGLETATSGDILIDNVRVNDLEPGARDIAMVFQSYALYPHMSVYDNMAYGLRNQGMPRAEIATRIASAAEILQLQDFLKRKPRQLSGGQRQRVAMGRAIVREPKAFLLDEPLSNLDAKLRTHMRGELKQLHQRLGATFIYVTHDQVEAMSLADRIVVMNAGRVEQIGTPRDVYDRPKTRFVAEFIGSPPMNFLPGTVLGGTEAWIGVRPEALRITTAENGSDHATGADLSLSGKVTHIEDLGADRYVHIALETADVGTDVVARYSSDVSLDKGRRVVVAASRSSLAPFDASGRAMNGADA